MIMTLDERSKRVLDGQTQILTEDVAVQVDEDVVPAPLPEASDGSDGSGGTDTDEDNTEEEEDGKPDGDPKPPR
jgi:hypothetical protein